MDKLERKERTEYYVDSDDAALDQANPSVHLNPQGKRNTATLYVGNLEFKTSEQDQRKSLDRFFKRIKPSLRWRRLQFPKYKQIEIRFHRDIMHIVRQ